MKSEKVIVAAVGLLAAFSAAALTLENEAMRIEFDSPENGYAVTAICNKLVNDTRFVHDDGTHPSFWSLELIMPGKVNGTNGVFTVDHRAKSGTRRVVKTEKGAKFHWEGLDVADEKSVLDVVASVEFGEDGYSLWRMAAKCRSAKWSVCTTFCPALNGIVREKADVLRPWGALHAALYKGATPEQWRGPNWSYSKKLDLGKPGCGPLFTTYNLGRAGLCLETRDGESRDKTFESEPGEIVRFKTIVERAGVVEPAAKSPGYPVAIGCYDGDWWTAARTLRAWTRRQKWMRKGKIAFRDDYPKKLSDISIWALFGADSGPGSSNIINHIAKAWPDLNKGAELTHWQFQPFDVKYPEMYPARFHFKDVVRYAHSKGVLTMPYTNGKLYAVDLLSYKLWAKDAVILDRDGGEAFEVWQSGRSEFRILCPDHPIWQGVLRELPKPMVDKYGTSGIYIDQIGAGPGRPCFNTAHRHAPGGGHYWADGFRAILEDARAHYAKTGAFITSECLCDDYIDVLDGQLNAQEPQPEDVPLYMALYSGYTTVFGNRIDWDECPSEAFFALQARTTLWGIAPGWNCGWYLIGPKRSEKIIRALGQCGRIRQNNRDFLAYGTLEGEAEVLDCPETVDVRWIDRRCSRRCPTRERVWTTPAVFGNVWKSADEKRTAAFLVNVGDRPRTVRVRFADVTREVSVPAHDFAVCAR